MSTVKSYFTKSVLVVLALQILNLSIYNTDFYVFNCFFPTKAQVKDINPIDSFAELMVEDVAGFDNAFPEPVHKNEKQSGELKHNISFKLYYQDNFVPLPEKEPQYAASDVTELPLFHDQYSFLFWKEINHPPA